MITTPPSASIFPRKRVLLVGALVVAAVPGLAQDPDLPIGSDLSLGTLSNQLSLIDMELMLEPAQQKVLERALGSQSETAAMNFLQRGDYPKSIESFEALGPLLEKPVNQLGLAMAEMASEKYAAAERRLLALIAGDPQQAIFLNNLAWLYVSARDVRMRNADKALRYARLALLEAPRDPRIWNTLSQAYYLQEKYHEATSRSKQAVLLMANKPQFGETLRLDLEIQYRKCENAARSSP